MMVAEEEGTAAEHEARMWIEGNRGGRIHDLRRWIPKQWGQSDRGGEHHNMWHKAKARTVMS